MRCKVICLIACLVGVACSQSLAVDKSVTDNNQALPSKETSNTSVSQRASNSYNKHIPDENTSKQSEYKENDGVENETNSTSEDDTENVPGTQSNEEDSIPQSSVITDSQENLTIEGSGVETGSGDASDDQSHDSASEDSDFATSEDISNDNERVEQTTHGPVKGYQWEENDIYAFIDIPYGKIEKPFEAPQTAQNWTNVHEVKEHNSRCPQYHDTYVGNLNCLTLSIFVPKEVKKAGVLFYVHDSSFHSGDPMTYGPEYLVSKGVILVLPNYRIGVLGFLCLQNETAPGNAGLKDLSLALEWTKNNIESFGGNPSNIVVGGHGDAGALAGYLALCSPSKSNIHKVITESGSMLSPLAFDRYPVLKAAQLAKYIRNDDSYENAYQNTFEEASVRKIVEAAKYKRFNPCIEHGEESFMSVSPWTMLQNVKITTDFMLGSASHAGTHEAVATSEAYIEELNKDHGLVFPEDLLFNTNEARNEQALRIKTQYFGTGPINRSQITELTLLSTDASYLGPLIRSARPLVEAGAAVYLYEFKFVGALNRELISLNNPVKGAVRSDIIGYLFTQNSKQLDEDTREAAMIRLMVDLWVSFINTGAPTAENITWNKMKAGADSEEEFLQISSECKLVKGVHVDRLRVWTELYNEYFIERSLAFSLTPGYFILITITFWVTSTKLDYH